MFSLAYNGSGDLVRGGGGGDDLMSHRTEIKIFILSNQHLPISQ